VVQVTTNVEKHYEKKELNQCQEINCEGCAFFLAYYVCLNHSNDVTLDVTTEPINLRQQTNFIPKADSVTIFLL
jgi:hypothetical protein